MAALTVNGFRHVAHLNAGDLRLVDVSVAFPATAHTTNKDHITPASVGAVEILEAFQPCGTAANHPRFGSASSNAALPDGGRAPTGKPPSSQPSLGSQGVLEKHGAQLLTRGGTSNSKFEIDYFYGTDTAVADAGAVPTGNFRIFLVVR